MTAAVISILAALATLAVVLIALRVPRITGAQTDERVAAVMLDMSTRMEAMRRELGEALERAQAEAGRHRFLGELAGATSLETVLRRTLEAAASLTEADGALLQTLDAEQSRIVANLGLAPEEVRRLTIAGLPEDDQPETMLLAYRYGAAEELGDEDPIRSGLAVAIPGETAPLGYLSVFTRSPARGFGDADVEALQQLVRRAGPAIENARLVHEARSLVGVDALTRLPNRREFLRHLAREVAQARRTHRRLALVLFDLEDFGALNRRFGPEVGDAALREAAERARDALGPDVFVARVGGDEFGIVLPGATLADADRVCRRLRASFAAPPLGEAGMLSFSAGIAELARDEESELLLQRADAALHRAQAGSAQVVASELG